MRRSTVSGGIANVEEHPHVAICHAGSIDFDTSNYGKQRSGKVLG
jgi:ligand-binding sensor protein